MVNNLQAVLEESGDLSLDHWGVKGMKWGRRKRETPNGRNVSRYSEKTSSTDIDEKNYRKNRSKEHIKTGAVRGSISAATVSALITGSIGSHTLVEAIGGAAIGAVMGKITSKIEDENNDVGLYSIDDLRKRGYTYDELIGDY